MSLKRWTELAGEVYRTVIFASILARQAAPIILDRGIKSTKYEGPKAPVLRRATRVPVADLRPVSAPTDASQPFPLFGTVKLEWERFSLVAPQNPAKNADR